MKKKQNINTYKEYEKNYISLKNILTFNNRIFSGAIPPINLIKNKKRSEKQCLEVRECFPTSRILSKRNKIQ